MSLAAEKCVLFIPLSNANPKQRHCSIYICVRICVLLCSWVCRVCIVLPLTHVFLPHPRFSPSHTFLFRSQHRSRPRARCWCSPDYVRLVCSLSLLLTFRLMLYTQQCNLICGQPWRNVHSPSTLSTHCEPIYIHIHMYSSIYLCTYWKIVKHAHWI